jgi:hypothetical protein
LHTDSILIYVYFACVVFVAVAVSHVLRSVYCYVGFCLVAVLLISTKGRGGVLNPLIGYYHFGERI